MPIKLRHVPVKQGEVEIRKFDVRYSRRHMKTSFVIHSKQAMIVVSAQVAADRDIMDEEDEEWRPFVNLSITDAEGTNDGMRRDKAPRLTLNFHSWRDGVHPGIMLRALAFALEDIARTAERMFPDVKDAKNVNPVVGTDAENQPVLRISPLENGGLPGKAGKETD